MKILLTADLHYSHTWYEWLIAKAPEVDLVAIAGDLVEGFAAGFRPDQKENVEYWLGKIVDTGCALAVSSGNHEMFSKISPKVIRPGLQADDTVPDSPGSSEPGSDCHPLFVEDGRIGIVESASGNLIVSTIPYTKYGDPLKISAFSPMWEEARALKSQTGCPWIVLHHDPPGGGPVGGMAGDFALRHAIEKYQPDFVISGHLHGQPFFHGGGFHEQIASSHCFNAGQTPPTKSQIPNHIILDTSRRIAVWFYFHLASGVFSQKSRFLS